MGRAPAGGDCNAAEEDVRKRDAADLEPPGYTAETIRLQLTVRELLL